MKNLTLSLILLTSLLSANDLAWVDEQVNAIKPPREGEINSNISKIEDPFIFLKKNSSGYDKKTKKYTKPKKSISSRSNYGSSLERRRPSYRSSLFTLSMVINNSALINGKWFKVGDFVKRYKIVKITKSSVTLKQNSKIKVISTATHNNNLKFKR